MRVAVTADLHLMGRYESTRDTPTYLDLRRCDDTAVGVVPRSGSTGFETRPHTHTHTTWHWFCLGLPIYPVCYIMSPWCRVLVKLTVAVLVKFPAFDANRRFITVLIRPPSVSCLSHNIAPYLFRIYLNVFLQSMCRYCKYSLIFRFYDQNVVCIFTSLIRSACPAYLLFHVLTTDNS